MISTIISNSYSHRLIAVVSPLVRSIYITRGLLMVSVYIEKILIAFILLMDIHVNLRHWYS